MRTKSLGQVLESYRGVGPGFDFLRVTLALSIVFIHALAVTGQYGALDDTPFWIVHYCLVPMFFSLSGFLISASAIRLRLRDFVINRSIRIVPALAVDTLVCALVIGPLFTTQPLHSYLTAPLFYSYFFNMIGYIHFNLPGVFDTFPVGRVNGALWTVPFEIACYILMFSFILVGWIRRRAPIVLMVACYVLAAILVSFFHVTDALQPSYLARVVDVAFIQHEAQAVTGFLGGIIIYQYRHKIPYSAGLFALSAACLLVAAVTMNFDHGQQPIMRLLLMPSLVYVIVFIGLTPMYLPRWFRTGDYSYGIYLYHMPLLQVVMALFPTVAFSRPLGFAFTYFAGLPLVLAIAWLSWHFVEKPCLAVRKRYSITARVHAAAPVGGTTTSAAAEVTAAVAPVSVST